MLTQHLHNAGFFAIHWVPAAPGSAPGTTYMRPSAKGVLRLFVPAGQEEVELYAGSLAAGERRYRGPAPSEAELRRRLAGAFEGRPLRHHEFSRATMANAA